MPLADAVPAGASVSRLGAVPGSRGGLVTQAHVARGSPRWRSVLVVGMPTGQGVSTCAQVREARSGRLTAFRTDCLGGTPTARGFEKAGGSPGIRGPGGPFRPAKEPPRRNGEAEKFSSEDQRPYGLWRSLVSALDWGSRGRGFKSRQPDAKHEVSGLMGECKRETGELVTPLSPDAEGPHSRTKR